MDVLQPEAVTTDKISHEDFSIAGLTADILRLDKLHPVISGNKWYKLRYYLDAFKQSSKKGIITFGGAWSNHIVATAAACRLYNIPCTGIIRGEKPLSLSPTLVAASGYGMHLSFISREQYASKQLPSHFLDDDFFVIPEGGYGVLGMEGAATILLPVNTAAYTHICCAAGTGTMTAGLLTAIDNNTQVLSVSVLKNNHSLEGAIRALLPPGMQEPAIIHDYHFGGYAKHTPALLKFMNRFYESTSVPSDFVYTGKLFYAICDLARKNYFPRGSRLLLVHSGGLQGNASLNKGTLIF